jgi:hypothetical protein
MLDLHVCWQTSLKSKTRLWTQPSHLKRAGDYREVLTNRQAPAPAQQYGTARRAFEAHLRLWSLKVEAFPTTRAPRIADVGPGTEEHENARTRSLKRTRRQYLKHRFKKKEALPLVQPVIPAWVGICLVWNPWEWRCRGILRTARGSSVRKPPATSDESIRSCVVQDPCPAEESKHIFHTGVPQPTSSAPHSGVFGVPQLTSSAPHSG